MQNTETDANDSESAVRSLVVSTHYQIITSNHLSGRGEVLPISNSAGEFADIDAGEAADIEEGIRRRPSAPAGSRADAGGTGRVPEEEVGASAAAVGNVTVSDRSSAMELNSTELSGVTIPIATLGRSTTLHICRTGVKEVLPESWRKRRIAAEGISWIPWMSCQTLPELERALGDGVTESSRDF